MRSCFSCADPLWWTARSHRTQLVKDGAMKARRRKKKHSSILCPPLTELPFGEPNAGSAMMTAEAQGTEWWGLYQRCGSLLNLWLRLAEWSRVLLAVTGPVLKKEIIFLKLESVEGRIQHTRSNMSRSPSVTQESQTLFVFISFTVPSLSDEPRAQAPPSHIFSPPFLKRNVGSVPATSCDAGIHLIPPVITGEYPRCHRLSWLRSQRFCI